MTRRQAWLAAWLITAVACGSSSGKSPTSPQAGSPAPSGATITISNTGAVSPTSVDIAAGQSVTFINQDSRNHEMASDPHPAHSDCPQINAVGVLAPGQTRLTNGLTTARTCGFHDHGDPDNTKLHGSIVIH
jgi:plastocyanin